MSITVELPFFGIPVDACTADEVAALVGRAEHETRGATVGNLNLHGLYLYLTEPGFRDYCDAADVLLIDGFPIWVLARLADRRVHRGHRIGSSDWLRAVLAGSVGRPAVVTAVGGTRSAARRAARAANESRSGVTWFGFDGFGFGRCDSRAESVLLEEALDKSDLVLVGLGMPVQEEWILTHVPADHHAVVANVGGCLDYLAGVQREAPRWLGCLGLEWAYRLVCDPRRLAHRYLVEPVALARIARRGVARP